jgi:hypothetical protein
MGIYLWQPTSGERMGMLSLVTINETGECREAAEVYLLENHKKGLRVKRVKILAIDVLSEEDVLGIKFNLIILGSRGSSQIPKIYSTPHLHC